MEHPGGIVGACLPGRAHGALRKQLREQQGPRRRHLVRKVRCREDQRHWYSHVQRQLKRMYKTETRGLQQTARAKGSAVGYVFCRNTIQTRLLRVLIGFNLPMRLRYTTQHASRYNQISMIHPT